MAVGLTVLMLRFLVSLIAELEDELEVVVEVLAEVVAVSSAVLRALVCDLCAVPSALAAEPVVIASSVAF